jgi:hypothetical protein
MPKKPVQHEVHTRERDLFLTLSESGRMNKSCKDRMSIPAFHASGASFLDVMFTCSKPKGHEDNLHGESGRVRVKGKVRIYTMVWTNPIEEVWRQEVNDNTNPV